jgi:hypothetical protein
MQAIYVPVLKGKEGEFGALETLQSDVKDKMMPLIELPSVPYDYANEKAAKSIDEHISGFAGRLYKCWEKRFMYLDLSRLDDEERLSDGQIALAAILNGCKTRGMNVVPVVSVGSSSEYVSTARSYSKTTQSGMCVRLVVADFGENIDLDSELDRLLAGDQIDNPSHDLVIDLEDLNQDLSRAILIARSIFSMIPKPRTWRRIILAASSFPGDLSDIDAATETTLRRKEWELWTTLQKKPDKLPRQDLIFGDYAIAHPTPKELDPRTMRMSASVRYTTPDHWLVVKGRNVRQYGFDQYFELCKRLIQRPEFKGAAYSWGDRYIFDCASGMTGPGNATTWRKVGTNHHVTLVVTELANLRPGT